VAVFANLGDPVLKGAQTFTTFAEAYAARYPSDPVEFFGFGNVPASPAVTLRPSVPAATLETLYASDVDVVFDLAPFETSERNYYQMNSWPLATEAVVRGAVLFALDNSGANARNGFRFRDGLTVVDAADFGPALDALHAYAANRSLLARHSLAIQSPRCVTFSLPCTPGPRARGHLRRHWGWPRA
jgi:hypothetical protein